jgi:hypothetical protein
MTITGSDSLNDGFPSLSSEHSINYHFSASVMKFNNKALDKRSNTYQSLCNGVKGVIVGLLKDRACAEDDSPFKEES